MKTFINIFLTVIILAGLSFNAFSQKKSKKGQEAVPTIFQEVPYVQLIQSAFASDFAGKGVIFEATFFSIMSMTLDLPSDYKEFIRIQLCSASSPTEFGGVATQTCENLFYNVVISKEKSTPVFSLKQGQKIKIKASAISTITKSGITAGTQSSILLVIDTIENVE